MHSNKVRLTVLGCSGTFPGPDSCCSSYLVEHEGFKLLIDCGTGAVGAMHRNDHLIDVDAVFLSHLHADHCLDLVAWYYVRYYHPEGPRPTVPVYGPLGSAERIARAFDDRPVGFDKVYDWRLAKPGHTEIGPFDVEIATMRHPIESLGIRLNAGGKSFAYSSDTAETDALPTLARDADLLLAEASWLDGPAHPQGIHMTGSQAARMGEAAGVDRLLLTHIVPWTDRSLILEEATAVRPDGTALALSDMVYDI